MSYEERRKELDEELKARGLNSTQRGSKTVAIMLDVLSEDKGHRFTDIYDAEHELTRLSFEVDLKRAEIERTRKDLEELRRVKAELESLVRKLEADTRAHYVLRGEDMIYKLRGEVNGIQTHVETSFGPVTMSGYGVKVSVLDMIDRYLTRTETIMDLLRREVDDGK